ncbi:MAG: hypothetical protein AMJ53_00465 [Gammaproteobacteria bacterium SG8_11]|nr:MAG: hypothetical protein AMJ53_00465 [Gammaproteobacteria bacterium SG8_11]
MNNIIQWLEQSSKTINKELLGQSVAYAVELCRLGVKPGDKVGVFFDNSPTYVSMLLAIWRLNAVVAPLAPKSLRQSRYVKKTALTTERYRIKVLIYSGSTNEEVLLEWMRLCDALAFSLDHFQQGFMSTHATIGHYEHIQPEDIAVFKIPQTEDVSMQDELITHAMLLQHLTESTGLTSHFTTKLLSLITLPLSIRSQAC